MNLGHGPVRAVLGNAQESTNPGLSVTGISGHSLLAVVLIGCGRGVWGLRVCLRRCVVDDHLGGDVRRFTPLPGLYLLSHRREVALHSIDGNRVAVDEQERLRVLRESGSEHATDGQDVWARPAA